MQKRPSDGRERRGGGARSWLLAVIALALLSSVAVAVAQPASNSKTGAPHLRKCLGQAATMVATPGGGKLLGTRQQDVIVGTATDDRIDGAGGNDLICGGAGNDVLLGSAGDDRLTGGSGNDLLRGGAGSDRCSGGTGNDKLKGCDKASETVRVNRVPLATGVSGSTGEDSSVFFDASALASDADGDMITLASLDTSASTGVAAIVDGGARVRFDPSGRFDRLAPGQTARDSFGYVVDDGHGGTASAKVTVTVMGADDPPKAIDDLATVQEGAAAAPIPVLANDSDPDAGPSSIESTTQPAHGVVAVTGGGLGITYQPNPGYCNDGEAADSFTYTLNGGSSATAGVTVSCVTGISISQGLSPKFDPGVNDYTVRCDGSPLDVSGHTAAGAEVAIDGQQPQTGSFQQAVPLEPNQEFSFTVTVGGAPSTYYVRCLPPDFPAWEYEGMRTPDHEFYVVDPAAGAGGSGYVIVFDRHGVPIWWQGSNPGPIDAKFISAPGEPTRITWWGQFGGGDGYQVRELDGTVVHTVSAVGGSTDIHELQETPNGNYLVISYQPREHVDLTALGGISDDTVVDAVVQEIDPSGAEVWSWSTQGHIGLDETGRWWPTALKGNPHDIVHMNAVEPDGEDAILISLRHTDAVYKIDKTTGDVVWKLGGTWTPKSLAVKGDPQGAYPLGGQHDVRLQPDGTISIHDNNTNLPDPPRVVRYAIDEGKGTATLVEEFTDPLVPSSFCCGSARRSSDGSWLLSWGGNSLVTEFNPAHERTFRLGFGGTAFSYRAAATDGALSAATLRVGMDSMHPRP